MSRLLEDAYTFKKKRVNGPHGLSAVAIVSFRQHAGCAVAVGITRAASPGSTLAECH
jgi:hypothetical protein